MDALAAAACVHGQDLIEVAVSRIEVRDEVLRDRQERPSSFPGFGPTDKDVVGRRVVSSLLDAGWRPSLDEEVVDAADRSRRYSARFDQWLSNLSPEQGGTRWTTTRRTTSSPPT